MEVQASLDEGLRRLSFAIADQGPGFDAAAIGGSGGLANMSDRISAVGGGIEVHTEPGHGTRVAGWVPVTRDAAGS